MRLRRSIGVAIALLVSAFVVSTSTATASAVETKSTYIVQVPDGQMTQLTDALDAVGETAEKKYYQGPDAVTTTLSTNDVQRLALALPQAQIVKNHPIYLETTPSTEQVGAPWHLKALNASLSGRASTYTYPTSGGSGVDVYLIDSGVDISTYANPGDQLYGRIRGGVNFALDSNTASAWHSPTNSDDCYLYQRPWNDSTAPREHWGGHGTHVAGLIASSTYGVAKSVNVIPERIFGCPEPVKNGNFAPSSSAEMVLAALDWAMAHKNPEHPSIISMSLGGGFDSVLNSKVQDAISIGFTVISAAGNSKTSACNSSPGAAPNAITVGAIGPDFRFASSYSNFGKCVTLLSPGSSIESVAAWGGSTVMSGTSMATPVVTGVAALYLATNPTASPAQVKSALVSQALPGIVSGTPLETVNRLVNTNFLMSPLSVGRSTQTVGSSATVTSVRLRWDAIRATAQGIDTAINDSTIRYRRSGSSSWSIYTHTPLGTSTSIRVNNLSRNTTYEFQVAGVVDGFVGEYSPTTRATTLSGLASAPRNMSGTPSPTRVTLRWTTPRTANGGGAVLDYRVYFRIEGSSRWSRWGNTPRLNLYTTVGGLARRTQYKFYVTARTQYGDGTANYLYVTTQ